MNERLNVFKTFNICLGLVFLLLSNQVDAQFDADTLDMIYEPRQLYVSVKIPELAFEDSIRTRLKKEIKGYYLVFLPPIYKTKEKTIAIPTDAAVQPSDTLTDSIDIAWRYEYLQSYVEPYISTKYVDRNCLSAREDSLINIEFREIPSFKRKYYGKVSRADFEAGRIDTIYHTFDFHYIETPYRIIKTPHFDPKDYDNIDYLKLIYLKGFNWSDFRMVLCTTPTNILPVSAVRRALRERGYDIPLTGVFDKKCRAALHDFQKKNGLKIGRLDNATLMLLNIEEYIDGKKYQHYRYKDSPIGPNYKN